VLYWPDTGSLLLTLAQCACVALPAAGVPRWTQQYAGSGWALIAPLSIVIVVAGIAALPESAQILTWVALFLVPVGAALAFGWAMHGAQAPLAALAAVLLVIAWSHSGQTAGDAAAILLIVGSCVTLGRLLAGITPLMLLKIGLVALAVIDAVLVFGGQLQGPNAVLVAAQPPAALPQLQSASLGGSGLGFGDFFAAAVVGGVLAADGRRQLGWATATLIVSLLFSQLFRWFDTLPATIPPVLVLLVAEAVRPKQA
jgi:hypothetical protein